MDIQTLFVSTFLAMNKMLREHHLSVKDERKPRLIILYKIDFVLGCGWRT